MDVIRTRQGAQHVVQRGTQTRFHLTCVKSEAFPLVEKIEKEGSVETSGSIGSIAGVSATLFAFFSAMELLQAAKKDRDTNAKKINFMV